VPRFALAALLVGAVTLGCSSNHVTAPTDGKFHVTVFNDSHIALTDIHVTTAEGSTVTIDRLEHGDLSDVRSVPAMHRYPAVSLTADGEDLVSIPVEGFIPGFNPALEPGLYVITVSVSDPPRALTVTVSQPVEDPSGD
jgi:hypothetical protein